MRTEEELTQAEEEYFDRLWYVRAILGIQEENREEKPRPPKDIAEGRAVAIRKIEKKYGKASLIVNDFELGMINGKLSALRWTKGSEWDFLDT